MLGVAGAGAWGLAQFLDGGTPAATAVPQDALAYLSLDLDPDGGQKLEVARTLRKFPAIKEKIGSGDDLRRWIFDAVIDEAPCDALDFAEDIDPWLGNKVAFAVLPAGEADDPVPMAAVEVKDQEAAEAGVETLMACGAEARPTARPGLRRRLHGGRGDRRDRRDIVARAEEGSLADDEEFGRWVDEAGGNGIVTGYVSAERPPHGDEARRIRVRPRGGPRLLDVGSELGHVDPMSPFGGPPTGSPRRSRTSRAPRWSSASTTAPWRSRSPAAARRPRSQVNGGSGMADLPATTALALGFGVHRHRGRRRSSTQLRRGARARRRPSGCWRGRGRDRALAPRGPADAARRGMSVAVDSSIDLELAVGTGGGDPAIPVGARIVGDPDEIVRAPREADRLGRRRGPRSSSRRATGSSRSASTPSYVASLAEDGALGEEAAVPGGAGGPRRPGRRRSTSTSTPTTGSPSSPPGRRGSRGERRAARTAWASPAGEDGDVVHGKCAAHHRLTETLAQFGLQPDRATSVAGSDGTARHRAQLAAHQPAQQLQPLRRAR